MLQWDAIGRGELWVFVKINVVSLSLNVTDKRKLVNSLKINVSVCPNVTGLSQRDKVDIRKIVNFVKITYCKCKPQCKRGYLNGTEKRSVMSSNCKLGQDQLTWLVEKIVLILEAFVTYSVHCINIIQLVIHSAMLKIHLRFSSSASASDKWHLIILESHGLWTFYPVERGKKNVILMVHSRYLPFHLSYH